MRNFKDIIEAAKAAGPIRLAVAPAAEHGVLEAAFEAEKLGLVHPILFGSEQEIRHLCAIHGFAYDAEIVDAQSDVDACRLATQHVSSGRADALMKGMTDTSVILREVLNKEYGLRTGRLLSHLAVYSLKTYPKLLYITDAGMNIAPDAEAKRDILNNAIAFCHAMGLTEPKIAVVCAKEKVDPNMPSTLDAERLVAWNAEGSIPGAIVEGPFGMDNAINADAAALKGLSGAVAGQADLLLMPNLDAGNILTKTLTYFAEADSAGLIVGARRPIVLMSRADQARVKVNSIALAVLAVRNEVSHV